MLKTGLSIAHFTRYIPIIEKETVDYFERWGDSGEKSKLIGGGGEIFHGIIPF